MREEGLLAENPGNQKFMISRNETNLIQIVDGRVGAGTVRCGEHALCLLCALCRPWLNRGRFLQPEGQEIISLVFIFQLKGRN